MPTYGAVKWEGYRVRVFADEWDILRGTTFLPYFWDSRINLDMVVDASGETTRAIGASIGYKWKLCDLDDNVIRSGQGSYSPVRGAFWCWRKNRAIQIGCLRPHECYHLDITLTDCRGNTSEPRQIATFSIKDRDDFKMQVLVGAVVVILGIILGFLLRGS